MDVMRAMTAMLAAGGIALAAWPGTTASQLAAAAFHERFEGQWQGTGTVQRSVDPAPRRVSCGVAGQATEQQITIGGTCRAAVIFTREIAANLTYDPATGRYVGTYIGSQAGPARLEGTRQGDTINLNVTYAQPVGTDANARMIISHAGGNQFSLTVMDQLEPGQPEIATTQLTFTQR
jgi:hypothetical protein